LRLRGVGAEIRICGSLEPEEIFSAQQHKNAYLVLVELDGAWLGQGGGGGLLHLGLLPVLTGEIPL